MTYKLDIRNLSKRYGEKVVLDDINLSLKEGIYSLLGPNGAGKTTLESIISGINKPTKGEILWCDKNIEQLDADYRRILGYMPQNVGFYPYFTAYEMMDYFSLLKNIANRKERIEELLNIVNLYSDKDKKIGKFSGGMLRRLGIAVTLLNDPKLLILDEPTAGLDPKERYNFKKYIEQLSKDRIVIISTHIISDIEQISDFTLMLNEGKIITEKKTSELIIEMKNIIGDSEASLEDAYMHYFGE